LWRLWSVYGLSNAPGDVSPQPLAAQSPPACPANAVRECLEQSCRHAMPAVPAALQAQALWCDMREISGGAMLMYRRLERSLMRRRLEAAAALIAGGMLRGGPPASGSAPVRPCFASLAGLAFAASALTNIFACCWAVNLHLLHHSFCCAALRRASLSTSASSQQARRAGASSARLQVLKLASACIKHVHLRALHITYAPA